MVRASTTECTYLPSYLPTTYRPTYLTYNVLLEAHGSDLTRVPDLLAWHRLTGSSDKATIAVSEVVFAGQVVRNGQQKPVPGKVAAIEHSAKPKMVSELQAYPGFCNDNCYYYYSGCIKTRAEYAAPITAMLKRNRDETKKGSQKAVLWNDESDHAFEEMKQALLSAVGLHLVIPDRGFVLRTDALATPLARCWSKCWMMGDLCPWPSGAESGQKAGGGRGHPVIRMCPPSSLTWAR